MVNMERNVGKYVENVKRMMNVKREVVYVKMDVKEAIGKKCER
jgi:hypothetical protein